MAGRKVFTREVLSSADVNGYLMDQTVPRFASSSVRGVAWPSPPLGALSELDSTGQIDEYMTINGVTGWVSVLNPVPQKMTLASGWAHWPSGHSDQYSYENLNLYQRGTEFELRGVIYPSASVPIGTVFPIAAGGLPAICRPSSQIMGRCFVISGGYSSTQRADVTPTGALQVLTVSTVGAGTAWEIDARWSARAGLSA